MTRTADDILDGVGMPHGRYDETGDDPSNVRYITATASPKDVIAGIFDSPDAVRALPWAYPEDDPAPALPSFPVEVLPGEMGAFAKALATYQQVSVDIPALVMLGALSVIAGGYATVTGQWRENTCNLYLAALADSGETKSGIVSAIAAPILVMERELRQAYDEKYGDMADTYEIACKTRDKLINKIADAKDAAQRAALKADLDDVKSEIKDNTPPPRPRWLIQDTTPEALARAMRDNGGHIGMLSDEGGFLGTLAGRYSASGAANIDLVLQGFDANMPYRRDRMGSESFEITHPSLAMMLCVQPAIVTEATSNTALLDRGLMYRFLFCLPESLAGHRDKRPPKVPGHLHADWDRTVRNVFGTVLPDGTPFDEDGELRPPIGIEVGERAEDLHYEWRVLLERRVDPDTGDLAPIKGWVKKLEGAVYRIAALLHIAAGEPSTLIGEHTMSAAIRIGDWAIPHAQRVFAAAPADAEGEAAEKACTAVLAWIRRKGIEELTVRDVTYTLKRQAWVKLAGAAGVRVALCELARRGYLTSVKRSDAAGKLLPDGLFIVHPKVHGWSR